MSYGMVTVVVARVVLATVAVAEEFTAMIAGGSWLRSAIREGAKTSIFDVAKGSTNIQLVCTR
jgi:hypothetical protein